MDHWKHDTVQGFCADVLLPRVEHYRSDVFITFSRLLELSENDIGIVLTRKNGCEEYLQHSHDTTFDGFECWAPESTGFFYVRRTHEETYFGPAESLKYQEVDKNRAERIIRIMRARREVGLVEPRYELKYPLLTGEQLHQKLVLASVKFDALTDKELEEWSEVILDDMIKNLDQDMLDPVTRDRIFMQEFISSVEEACAQKIK